jgi:hypothetical protein
MRKKLTGASPSNRKSAEQQEQQVSCTNNEPRGFVAMSARRSDLNSQRSPLYSRATTNLCIRAPPQNVGGSCCSHTVVKLRRARASRCCPSSSGTLPRGSCDLGGEMIVIAALHENLLGSQFAAGNAVRSANSRASWTCATLFHLRGNASYTVPKHSVAMMWGHVERQRRASGTPLQALSTFHRLSFRAATKIVAAGVERAVASTPMYGETRRPPLRWFVADRVRTVLPCVRVGRSQRAPRAARAWAVEQPAERRARTCRNRSGMSGQPTSSSRAGRV